MHAGVSPKGAKDPWRLPYKLRGEMHCGQAVERRNGHVWIRGDCLVEEIPNEAVFAPNDGKRQECVPGVRVGRVEARVGEPVEQAQLIAPKCLARHIHVVRGEGKKRLACPN